MGFSCWLYDSLAVNASAADAILARTGALGELGQVIAGLSGIIR